MAHSPSTMLGGEYRKEVVARAECRLDEALDSARKTGLMPRVRKSGEPFEISFRANYGPGASKIEESRLKSIGIDLSLSDYEEVTKMAPILSVAEMAVLAERYIKAGWAHVDIVQDPEDKATMLATFSFAKLG